MKSIYLFAFLIFASWSISSDAACTTKYKSHLRGAPTTDASIISSLPKFSPLQIVETQNHWVKVKGLKFEGWIFHSLIDKDLECMSVKDTNNSFCPSKRNQKTRDIVATEGFRILKKEIGCNQVLDKYGKRIWLNNISAWPESTSMKILIN
ncbi:SH3 domain-containing protein [Halobacteriovorax sp.]|uniref:SH3 domain-containing protein n=1 Tax=Halobacteriovorax sp. TaxID=2020862 RepID=UPI0035649137